MTTVTMMTMNNSNNRNKSSKMKKSKSIIIILTTTTTIMKVEMMVMAIVVVIVITLTIIIQKIIIKIRTKLAKAMQTITEMMNSELKGMQARSRRRCNKQTKVQCKVLLFFQNGNTILPSMPRPTPLYPPKFVICSSSFKSTSQRQHSFRQNCYRLFQTTSRQQVILIHLSRLTDQTTDQMVQGCMLWMSRLFRNQTQQSFSLNCGQLMCGVGWLRVLRWWWIRLRTRLTVPR